MEQKKQKGGEQMSQKDVKESLLEQLNYGKNSGFLRGSGGRLYALLEIKKGSDSGY